MKLAADANVLLSALIGGRAMRVLRHPAVEEILTAAATVAEVQEYAGQLAKKKGLAIDMVLLAAAALPVTVVDRLDYAASLPEARRRIGRRDPDDVELLALALHHRLPVWSNDNDFEDAGITRHTTASLLTLLGSKER